MTRQLELRLLPQEAMSEAPDWKALIRQEHERAEAQRLAEGWPGCGCADCQELYSRLDLEKYGKRVSRSIGGIVAIGEDKSKLAKLVNERWVGADQICLIQGQGYAVAPDGVPLFMGAEAEILEALKTGKVPDSATFEQRAEYERIFELRGGNHGDTEQQPRGNEQRIIKTGGFRTRPAANAQHKPVNTRHLAKRKGLPLRKTF